MLDLLYEHQKQWHQTAAPAELSAQPWCMRSRNGEEGGKGPSAQFVWVVLKQ